MGCGNTRDNDGNKFDMLCVINMLVFPANQISEVVLYKFHKKKK